MRKIIVQLYSHSRIYSLTCIAILGLVTMGKMYDYVRLCSIMLHFESPLIENVLAPLIFDLSMRKIRVTRVSGQFSIWNYVVK